MSDLKNYLDKQLQDKEFKEEWETLEPEFSVMQAMIDARKSAGLTQKQLSEKLPNNVMPKVINPQGILLLGRSEQFNQQQKNDFELIKRQYKHIADIMTYDDLIQRIDNILAALNMEIRVE